MKTAKAGKTHMIDEEDGDEPFWLCRNEELLMKQGMLLLSGTSMVLVNIEDQNDRQAVCVCSYLRQMFTQNETKNPKSKPVILNSLVL